MQRTALKVGDKVSNIFTKEIGTVVEIRKNGQCFVRYARGLADLQKREWINLLPPAFN